MSKFDLHIHSCYSEGILGTRLFSPPSKSLPEQIIKKALSKGIDIISVADHDNIVGSLRTIEIAKKKYKNKILVIPGVEVSSNQGHILAYNVYDNIPKGLSIKDTLKEIKKKGGVAVAAHTLDKDFSISLENLIKYKKDFFAFEVANSYSFRNKEAKEFVDKYKLPYTVGSDAHSLSEIGSTYGLIRGKVNSINDFLEVISKRQILQAHSSPINLYSGKVKTALPAFFYWKFQQVKHIFDKSVFLPYLDKP
jgi:hypothetical protein